jgi:hypothetical protein
MNSKYSDGANIIKGRWDSIAQQSRWYLFLYPEYFLTRYLKAMMILNVSIIA